MLIPAEAVAQRRYVRSARQTHPIPSLGIGPAILRGLRDLGYRDSIAALCALVDNAIDAQASEIDIILDARSGVTAEIAVVDNGIGMVPEMLRAACAVGVSCSLGDGPHLARSGFGLPSAPFAVGTQFEIISAPAGLPAFGVVLDLAELTHDDVVIPDSVTTEVPRFVTNRFAAGGRRWTAGTMVILRDVDRLTTRAPATLRQMLRARLGLVFAHFAGRIAIRVDGERVPFTDPLFLRHEDGQARAEDDPADAVLDCGGFEVPIAGAALRVRTALLPPTFIASGPTRTALGKRRDPRFGLVRDTNGIIITRLGRHLAVLPSTPLFNFLNSDRMIRVEIDFPPDLDDLLAPSLSLQQVNIASSVWTALRKHGVAQHLEHLRRRSFEQRRQPWTRAIPADITEAQPRRRNRCQKEG